MAVGHQVAIPGQHHAGSGTGSGAGLAGDGGHRWDILLIDGLQGKSCLLGNIFHRLGGFLYKNGHAAAIRIGGEFLHSLRQGLLQSNGAVSTGRNGHILRGKADRICHLFLALGLGKQLGIDNTQHGDDAEQENDKDHQH